MKRFLILLTILALTPGLSGFSQNLATDTLRPRYGGFAGYGLNLHSANFSRLPGVDNCCPLFETGSGSGLSIGALIEYPLGDYFLIGARAGYFSKSGLLSKEQDLPIMIDLQDATGTVEHSVDAGLATLSLQPELSYRIIKYGYIRLGARAGIYMQKSYDQKEEIVSPSNRGVFADTRQRTRNVKSGDIEEVSSMDLSIVAGFGYELPLNKKGTLILSPEVYYVHGLTDVTTETEWKVSSLTGGISIKYSPFETVRMKKYFKFIDTTRKRSELISEKIIVAGQTRLKERLEESADTVFTIAETYRTDTLMIPIVKKTPPPPPKIEKPEFETELAIIGNHGGGLRLPADKIEMKTQYRKEVYPLLPYVFFAEESAQIPARYDKLSAGANFNIDDISPNPVVFHHNVLNIIAERLKSSQTAKLYIKGYTDPTTEPNDCELARQRAEAVRDYLSENRGVNEDKLIVSVGLENCYPVDVTKSPWEDGFAENRRVETSSNDDAILSPVKAERYLYPLSIKPPELEIVAQSTPGEEFQKWDISITHGGKTIYRNSGYSATDTLRIDLYDLNPQNFSADEPIVATITATSKSGETKTAARKIALEKKIDDYEVESLTLTLFKVSQATLDRRLKNEIRAFIEGLAETTNIHVTGYCDRLGDKEANLELSKTRAQEVEQFINYFAPKAEIENVDGVGSNKFPPGVRSYDTPEERFMSRTVEIEIRKKRD